MNSSIKILFCLIIALLIPNGCRQPSEDSSGLDINYPNLEVGKTITVSSPAERELYRPGDTILIKWITSASKLDIFLYRKTVLKIRIRQNQDNLGEIIWQIPSDIPHSNHYIIKLVNSSNEEGFGYSGMFGIQGD
jgi:hypothetical protein